MHDSDDVTPLHGHPGYYLFQGQVYSATKKRFLKRYPSGTRWFSRVPCGPNKTSRVFLDDPNREQFANEAENLRNGGAEPIPGFPDHCIKPDGSVYRVNPATRGPTAGALVEVKPRVQGRKSYVQLMAPFGRRSTYSVEKLLALTFGSR